MSSHTRPLYNPLSLEIMHCQYRQSMALPLAEAVIAGFPSPAGDYEDVRLDLNEALIRNPTSTFFARVQGNSMIGAGIDDGDLLVVDKSIVPYDGAIAVSMIDGDFTLKTIKLHEGRLYLMPANPDYAALEVTEANHFAVWGVVTYVIKKK